MCVDVNPPNVLEVCVGGLRFGRQSADILRRQKLFQFVWRVVFDQIAGVCERYNGVGTVLTEDDNYVLGFADYLAEQ